MPQPVVALAEATLVTLRALARLVPTTKFGAPAVVSEETVISDFVHALYPGPLGRWLGQGVLNEGGPGGNCRQRICTGSNRSILLHHLMQ